MLIQNTCIYIVEKVPFNALRYDQIRKWCTLSVKVDLKLLLRFRLHQTYKLISSVLVSAKVNLVTQKLILGVHQEGKID